MTTQSFSYNGIDGTGGTAQDFVVPAGVTAITVDLIGARGAGNFSFTPSFQPGVGGHVAGTVAVTPGETLKVYVGGTKNSSDVDAGFNGGGRGFTAAGGAGGGGGGTDIRRTPYALADRLMVAAGGAGYSGFVGGTPPSPWGAGGDGGVTGSNGTGRPEAGFTNALYGGKGATASAGGAAAAGSGELGPYPTAGSLGQGGDGGGNGLSGGSGGGGGYYGGGGGFIVGAGGGGSNYVGIATSTTSETSTRTALHGTATLTYSAAVGSLGYQSDIPFIVANDRRQVVLLPDIGTSTTTAEFRYFYGDAPLWGEELTADVQFPAYYLTDEKGDYVGGTLELPFSDVKRWEEFLVDAVEVEFATRPTSLANDPAGSIGFDCRVEGYGVSPYGSATGIASSTTITYTTGVATQDATYWPNSRTVRFPVGMEQRTRAARAVLTNIRMVEIKRVKLLGSRFPGRQV